MCVIYLLSQDVHVQKDHERLILLRGEEKVASVPLYEVHSVIATKSAHLTTPLLFSLMEREIPVFYVNGRGELLGTCGAEFLRLDHQLAQQEAFRDEPRRQAFVHDIVSQKITHQRALLQAYASRRKSETLATQAKKLKLSSRQPHMHPMKMRCAASRERPRASISLPFQKFLETSLHGRGASSIRHGSQSMHC